MSPSYPRLAKRQDPSGTSAVESSPASNSPTSRLASVSVGPTQTSDAQPTTTEIATTSNPPQTTSNPPQTTSDPPETTSNPPQTTSDPPQTTSDPPQTTSNPPVTSSNPPVTSQTTASATPTPTPTPTPSQTPSQSESQTPSQTQSLESATPSQSSQSETPSATPSQSQIPTPSPTATPSQTASLQSETPSQTATPSQSASQSASQPVSETPSESSTAAQVTPSQSQSATSREEQTSQAQSTRIVTVTSRQSATQLPVSTRRADTTAESSFFITFTRSDGQLSTSAPAELTSMVVTTRSDGGEVTVTQIVAQPTGGLNPDGGGRGTSAFFQNKGAVAGVFLIVGIAGAAILAFLFLAYRRRRRHRQNERDAVIAASLGPSSRVPFEDDDDDEPTNNSHGMIQRNPFAYAAGTPHAVGQHGEYLGAGKGSHQPYDPYAAYPVPTASSSGHQHSTVHTRVGSGGLDGYEYDYRHYQAPSATGAMPDPRTSPTSPRRAMSPTSGSSQAPTYAPGLGPSIVTAAGPSGQNNKRVSGTDSASLYSMPEGSLVEGDEDDQRLNSDMLGMRLRGGVGSSGSLRDDEDYSRKVLTVTNAT